MHISESFVVMGENEFSMIRNIIILNIDQYYPEDPGNEFQNFDHETSLEINMCP